MDQHGVAGSPNRFLNGDKGRDGFPLDCASPDHRWQKIFHEFLLTVPKISYWERIKFAEYPSLKLITGSPVPDQAAAVAALIRRRIENEKAFRAAGTRSVEASNCAQVLEKLTVFLLGRIKTIETKDIIEIFSVYRAIDDRRFYIGDAPSLLKLLERFRMAGTISSELHQALEAFSLALRPDAQNDTYEATAWRRTREQFEEILRTVAQPCDAMGTTNAERTADILDGLDPWAGAISDHVKGLDKKAGDAWYKLLIHARTATQTRPSSKWLKEAVGLLDAVGRTDFQTQIVQWFPQVRPSILVNKMNGFSREPMLPANAEILRGLVWICSLYDEEAVTRAVSDLGQAVYKKLPGWGPLSAKVGNACLFTLSQLPGLAPIAQLGRLRLKVKYSMALEMIDRALTEAANKLGMTGEELEEVAVPTYGLDANGCLSEQFGDFTAMVEIVGTHDVNLKWIRTDGTTQKSVPAEVKEAHSEELKELKRTVQDIEKMLPAQRERLERLLSLERKWALETWRDRYLNHPLLRSMTRRLIWYFQLGERAALGVWRDGKLVDIEDQPLDWLAPETQVRLWHPIGFPRDTVSGWRRWLEKQEVTQPFKQAHREVYILTEAERRTNTYSNRFAGHVIKQHQFAALAQQRGWRYSLQGAFDSHNTPRLGLPQWNLSVEFWTAGAMENVSDHGIYLYLSTDQVRFIQEGQPVPLHEVPTLAFTEAMRDIDLFVGVCSIGNDPAWQDRGDAGQLAYWHRFSFGDLSALAETRKETLERLVPRLKVASRCSLNGNYLVVRGELRTYKIHLGSANILMEPNDQYLCIVPDRGNGAKATESILLPFEGDQMLAVILSKALLLADDLKIKDPSILSQIKQV